MSWWNSLSDFTGDLGSIIHGKNPMNQGPPVNIPATGGVKLPGTPNAPYTGQTISANGDDPSGSVDGDPTGGSVVGGDSNGGFDISGLTGALKTGGSAILDWVKAHPTDLMNLVGKYSDYQRQKQGDTYAKDGLALATSEYNDPNGKAALRTAGVAGMLNPRAGTPDLSHLQTIAGSGSGNPFTKALPLAPLNHPSPPTTTPGALPLAGAPLTGVPNITLPQPGQQTGPPPTIPPGMKPPVGWVPPKALPLATS